MTSLAVLGPPDFMETFVKATFFPAVEIQDGLRATIGPSTGH
jgi:hypothetical protein